jgi:hypothetical protein
MKIICFYRTSPEKMVFFFTEDRFLFKPDRTIALITRQPEFIAGPDAKPSVAWFSDTGLYQLPDEKRARARWTAICRNEGQE